ncbi:hypothetical protein LINPERHAP2_LOCUS4510, partial [Linum perenne]
MEEMGAPLRDPPPSTNSSHSRRTSSHVNSTTEVLSGANIPAGGNLNSPPKKVRQRRTTCC